MVELICIDVDGTLVGSSGTVLPAIWPAAARARARGIRLSICSGRPAFGSTRHYAECLDADGWHVFQNGASVVHLPTGRSRSAPLPAGTIAELVERSRRLGRTLELYTDDAYAVETDDERARRHAGLLGLPFAPRPFDALRGPIVRAQWLIPSDELDDLAAEPHPGLNVSPSTSPVMPDTTFVNLTVAGVDKAHAVAVVAREYGIGLDRVMVVGDGHNDAAAMRAVGYPVAMANADDAAREAGRIHVGHVDEGGLVEALELAVRSPAPPPGAAAPAPAGGNRR